MKKNTEFIKRWKLFWAWQDEKEAAWLRKMSNEGWHLIQAAPFLYTFRKGEKKDYVAAERDVIGTDHAEVGALLAEHWNLPATLRSVIAYHHKPGKAQEADRPLVYVIHLADVVAKMGGTGTGSDSFLYTLDEHYKEYVSISLVDLGKIYYHTGIEYEKIVAAMFAGK